MGSRSYSIGFATLTFIFSLELRSDTRSECLNSATAYDTNCRANVLATEEQSFKDDQTAIPIVDEIATVPLNIRAEEHGYWKLEPNLLGM